MGNTVSRGFLIVIMVVSLAFIPGVAGPMISILCAIGVSTLTIVSSIREQTDRVILALSDLRPKATRQSSGGVPSGPAPLPLGKRPGETDEQWAARMEAAEVASFKARYSK